MSLISPGGENLLDFLELWQVLLTYDRDLRDPIWWPQERPFPMRVSPGHHGIPVQSMPGPRTLCSRCLLLRLPERVTEVPVLSREHLPQLEKIQEVLPSRRDEAHFC